jgi:hypothetical protein
VAGKVWEREELETVMLLVKALQALGLSVELPKLQRELLFLCGF